MSDNVILTPKGEFVSVEHWQLHDCYAVVCRMEDRPRAWYELLCSFDSKTAACEYATKFAADPRFARYYARANREDRVRILALLPGETAWRNLYSHHTYSGTYDTLEGALKG